MKKLISSVLTAAVICGSALSAAVPVSAAEDNGYILSASFDKAETEQGGTFTMTVSLDENPGLVSVRFRVRYDPDAVTIAESGDIKALEDFGVSGSFTAPKANNEAGTVLLRWNCPLVQENITKTGDLAAIKFTVKSDAPIGSTGISIEPVEINMIDENLDWVDLEEKYGTDIEGYFKTPSESDIDKLIKISCTHNWGNGAVTTEPDCTNKGVKTYTCSICGETKTEELEALGHDWDEGTVTTEPTCTEKGVKTVTCTRCNETKTEEIEALGHDWDEGTVTTEPTCTEKGVKTVTCTRCNETKTEEIEALGHDWGEWTVTKEPTTDVEGEEARECNTCGERETRAVAKLPAETTLPAAPTYTGGDFYLPETTAASAVPAESEAAPESTAEITTAVQTSDTTAAAVPSDSTPPEPDNGNSTYDTDVTANAPDTGNAGNTENVGSADDKNRPTGIVLSLVPFAAAGVGVLIFKKKK